MKFNLIFANPNSLIDAQIIQHGLTSISNKNEIKIVKSRIHLHFQKKHGQKFVQERDCQPGHF